MRYGLITLILLIHVLAFGQKSGSISGKVLDSENNIVEFVNVFLTSVISIQRLSLTERLQTIRAVLI